MVIESLQLDGALKVTAKPSKTHAAYLYHSFSFRCVLLKYDFPPPICTDQKVVVKAGYVRNDGYETRTEWSGPIVNEVVAMRGYTIVKIAEEEVQGCDDKEVIYHGPENGTVVRCLNYCEEPV